MASSNEVFVALIATAIASFALIYYYAEARKRQRQRQPSGPWPWPIVGNFPAIWRPHVSPPRVEANDSDIDCQGCQGLLPDQRRQFRCTDAETGMDRVAQRRYELQNTRPVFRSKLQASTEKTVVWRHVQHDDAHHHRQEVL